MARIHGKSGSLYVAIASGGTATPIAYITDWAMNAATDKVEVTALGDSNKSYVSGLPDAQGTFSGFYDDATAQTYTAATDGIARKFYLYPNTGTAQYWFGTGLFDFSVTDAVNDAVKITGNWAAATIVQKVG